MNIKILYTTAALMVIFLFSTMLKSQQTVIYDNPDDTFRKGTDLIEKKQFGAAQSLFEQLVRQLPAGESVMRLEAEYLDALCDYKLDHPQAVEKFTDFISHYPDHSKTNEAYLHLGFIHYSNRKYRDAIANFERVDPFMLGEKQHAEYLYKLGYAYLKNDNPGKAREVFFPILNISSEYQNAATYYYAYLVYKEGNYKEALTWFEKVEHDEQFGAEIPVYLLQINFALKDYDAIIKMGPELVAGNITDKKKKTEASRIVGEAFYRKGEYTQAAKYLEMAEESSKSSSTPEQNFQLGFSSYKAGDYQKAAGYFQKTVNAAQKTETTQNAWFHLADCYLQTGEKKFAQNAFYSASQMDFNEEVKEDALFNYAKLTYDLAYDPFNQSMGALNEYISKYPNSNRIEEAYSYLTNLLLSTKNYQAAIDAIEKYKTRNNEVRAAYQTITYRRGVQLFNMGQFDEAIENFRKTQTGNANVSLATQAKFWIGESFYRLGNYQKAMDAFDDFLVTPGASKLDNYLDAKYNLGYCWFRMKYYEEAIQEFEQFLLRPVEKKAIYQTDAMMRLGDCYYITKNFSEAIDFYDKAIRRNSSDSDYALYQKAMSEGALGERSLKISLLKQLLTKYPKSGFADDATWEIASAFLLLNDNTNALEWFNRLQSDFPKSGYLVKSMQKEGLVLYNESRYDQALEILKKLIQEYPGTAESREALNTIRNIYVDKNEVGKYYDYARNIPFANVTATEQDSVTYFVGENLYLAGKCPEASLAFSDYLNRFPDGGFALNAHYYKAECDFNTGNKSGALAGYEWVAGLPKSGFTENALLKASSINFENKEYSKALDFYQKLELNADNEENIVVALTGQMNCLVMTGKFDDAATSANKVLQIPGIGNNLKADASYILGKAAFEKESYESAKINFQKVVSLSGAEKGAESKYLLATIHFRQKDYKKAEELVFELADEYSSFEYWKASGFILLADIYTSTGNAFQARQTLQSIIENYPGEDLKKIASKKLETLVENEKNQ